MQKVELSKKMLLLPALLLGLFCLGRPTFAANEVRAETGLMVIQEASGVSGGEAVVRITADSTVKNLAGLLLVLNYDPALKLSEKDIVAGPLCASSMKQVNLKQKGQLTLGLVSSKGVQGPGEVARLTFRIPPGASPGKIYSLKVSKIETNDSNADLTTVQLRDGRIKVLKAEKKMPKGKLKPASKPV